VGLAGFPDEATESDERGGQVEVKVDDRAVAVGAATELAVVVHPGVHAFHDPAFTHLDGARDALFRELADESVVGEYVAAGFAVVAESRCITGFSGSVPTCCFVASIVGSSKSCRFAHDPHGHAAGVGGDRAFQAAFAAIDR
jgi:hypothetical protein